MSVFQLSLRRLALFAIAAIAVLRPAVPAMDLPLADPPTGENQIVIHYHRYDGTYDQPGLWVWDGRSQKQPDDQELLAKGRTDFGPFFVIDQSLYGNDDSPDDRVGYIVRMKRDWNHKDGGDRFWTADQGRVLWIVGNDPKVYTSRPDISPRVVFAKIDGLRRMTVKFSKPMPLADLKPTAIMVVDAKGEQIPADSAAATKIEGGNALLAEVILSKDLDVVSGTYFVEAEGYKGVNAQPGRILDNADLYGSDKRMGASWSEKSTTFRLFSPLARNAAVVLFDEPTGAKGRAEHPMENTGKGVWEKTIEGNLEGKHYRLRVETEKYGVQELNDPFATNTTGDDGNARITDLRKTDPPGFRPIARPDYGTSPVDAVIYQLHIRDFSISPTSGVAENLRGKYLGFATQGTTLPGSPDIKTTVDHLRELGVTHVQLQPMQDFDNEELNTVYNWGYMTAFFNSPEGWFASDIRGTQRISEFKTMVAALKDAGIGVILDVVYNHTGTQNTFEKLSPNYYLRQRDDGSFYNGSGTGNEFRSEAPMGRRFLVESCRYWVEEYGIDGFRFDLMGLIDLETMQAIRKEVQSVYPQVMFYGEPWAATGPDGTGIARIVYKDVVKGTGIGAFNDHFRDSLKGSPDGDEVGYVQNGSRKDGVVKGIAGSVDDWSASPEESINYVSVHDNLDLWDKLLKSAPNATEEEHIRMVKLAGGLLSVSQGIMLLHGGTDFLRYKQGAHNSYNAGDGINQIDWQRKKTYFAVHEYFRAIIAIRRAHPMFRLRTADDIRARLRFHEAKLPASEAIAFTLDGGGIDGEAWSKAAVLVNPTTRDLTFAVPMGFEGSLAYIHDGAANPTGLTAAVTGATVIVPARSMTLLAVGAK